MGMEITDEIVDEIVGAAFLIGIIFSFVGFVYFHRKNLKTSIEKSKPSKVVEPPKPLKLLKWKKHSVTDFSLHILYDDNSVGVFRGWSTDWRYYPSGNKCSISMSLWLLDRFKTVEWEISDAIENGKLVRKVMEE